MSVLTVCPPHAHNEPHEDEDVLVLMPTKRGARILLCLSVCAGIGVLLWTVGYLWVKSLFH